LRGITILLLFVIAILAGSFPKVISQSFTSFTTVLAATGLSTTNVYSTNTIGSTTKTIVLANTLVSTADTTPGLNPDPTIIVGIAVVILVVLGTLLFAKSRKGKLSL
jgi:hypothetical protein